MKKLTTLALLLGLHLITFGQASTPLFLFNFDNNKTSTGSLASNFIYISEDGNSTFVSDRNNLPTKALRLTSSTAFTSNSFPAGNASRTVSFWINFNAISSQNIFSFGNAIATRCFALQLDASGILKFSNFQNNFNSTFAPVTDRWYQIVTTYEQSTTIAKMYVNGVLSYTSTNMDLNTSTSGGFYLGSIVGAQTAINAQIDDLAIYSTALTANEISQNYTATAPAPTIPILNNVKAGTLSTSSGVISATVNPNGANTTVFVNYGTSMNSLPSRATLPTVISGYEPQNVSITLSGLLPNTTYFYQVVAENSVGNINGNINQFSLSNIPIADFYFPLDGDIANSGSKSITSTVNFNNSYVVNRKNETNKALSYGAISTTFSSNDFPSANNDRTVSFWIKFNANTAQNIFSFGNPLATQCFALQLDGTGILKFSNYQNNFNSAFSPIPNKWYFISTTYEKVSSLAKLYVDGDLKYTSTGMTLNTPSGLSNFYLGSIVGAQTAVNSVFDDFRIYSTLFSDTQVNSQYLIESGTITSINSDKNNLIDNTLLYPNPAKDILHVSGSAEIFDLVGNKVAEGTNEIKIDHLLSGIYVVKANGKSQKIVKE